MMKVAKTRTSDAGKLLLYYRLIIPVSYLVTDHDARTCSFKKYERILIMSTSSPPTNF
jgi:hypothetical protein